MSGSEKNEDFVDALFKSALYDIAAYTSDYDDGDLNTPYGELSRKNAVVSLKKAVHALIVETITIALKDTMQDLVKKPTKPHSDSD